MWGDELLDVTIGYTGDGNGYKGAQLDNEVIPRIVQCVNACAGVGNPTAFMESVREHAQAAYDALLRFDGDEDTETARDHLSAIIGSLR